MRNYFARVELHDAEWPDDYEYLHALRAKIGFTPASIFRMADRRSYQPDFTSPMTWAMT